MSRYIFGILAPAMILLPAVSPAMAQERDSYQILSEFGDLFTCDVMAGGIFLVWWDKSNDLSEAAAAMLDSMDSYRETCLDVLEMKDPPNPRDGFYFNVYLHEPGDVFPDGWACGVGTDTYGYPYMTIPVGGVSDFITISHETFHAFQYSGNSPGFDPPDANWYVEATANWFAAINYPDHPSAFVESQSLVRIPHVPLWLGYANFPDSYPENWQRYVHQYALALFLFYLTEERGLPYSMVCGGFYYPENTSPQELLPQEYLYYYSAGLDFRTLFVDWAAHMTNDFDFILQSQKDMAQLHWDTYADPQDDNEFILVLDDTGTGGWFRPDDSLTTTGWSFNTYMIQNSSDDTYSFHLKGDGWDGDSDAAHFRGKVLVRNPQNGARFYDLEMTSNVEGHISIDVSSDDTELYLIVASVPDIFTDVERIYGYEVNIEKGAASATGPAGDVQALVLQPASPNPSLGTASISFSMPEPGHARLTVYDLTGHLVATLLEAEMPAGLHEASWSGTGPSGVVMPGGIYLIRLEAAGQTETGMVTLLR